MEIIKIVMIINKNILTLLKSEKVSIPVAAPKITEGNVITV